MAGILGGMPLGIGIRENPPLRADPATRGSGTRVAEHRIRDLRTPATSDRATYRSSHTGALLTAANSGGSPACGIGRWSGVADSEQSALQDRDRSGQAGGFGEGGQVTDGLGGGGLVGQAEHDDAGVAAGRVGADVARAAAEGDQDSPGSGGGGDDVRVGRAGQVLGDDGVGVMACAGQDGRGPRPAGSRRA